MARPHISSYSGTNSCIRAYVRMRVSAYICVCMCIYVRARHLVLGQEDATAAVLLKELVRDCDLGTYVYASDDTHTHTHTYTHARANAHINTHIHTHAHTNTQTQTQAKMRSQGVQWRTFELEAAALVHDVGPALASIRIAKFPYYFLQGPRAQ
jgi:hypothetical protein